MGTTRRRSARRGWLPVVIAIVLGCYGAIEAATGSPAAREPAAAGDGPTRKLDGPPGRPASDPRSRVAQAYALAREARDTANTDLYQQADALLAEAAAGTQGDFAVEKARVWMLLGRHEFAEALRRAEALERSYGADLQLLGMLADARVELGRYAAAEAAAQRMLDRAPGNPGALARASYLRELYGDLDGARELMLRVLRATPRSATADRAWSLVHLAQLERQRGAPEQARFLLDAALELFPEYHYALAARARLHADADETAEAVEHFRRRYEVAPHPECLFDLARALERAGRTAEARAAFEEFETAAREEMHGWDNANHALIRYYVEHAGRPTEALRIAERERARRADVFTRTAYASALAAVGRREAARAEMEAVLAVGTRDPEIRELADRLRR